MFSGELVRATTDMPDGCGDGDLGERLGGTPSESACSRQLSATVRTCSRPSEVVTWPVTVSASTSRTCWPWLSWRAEARFVATVVLPTPPFGLKTAMTVARFCQSPISVESHWMIGPEPSSIVIDRMHIASTRQRSESAE